MNPTLHGEVAPITGGSRSIGNATAVAFRRAPGRLPRNPVLSPATALVAPGNCGTNPGTSSSSHTGRVAMRNIRLAWALAATVCFLTACTSSAHELSRKLQRGMPIDQVRSTLGQPDIDKFTGFGRETFVYKVSDGYFVVTFVEGRVEGFARHDRISIR